MHKISKTELMKVNNATWIYVKVCIKPQITLSIYFIMNYVILLGSIPKYA